MSFFIRYLSVIAIAWLASNFLIFAAYASVSVESHVARVPVSDQSRQTQQKAQRQALEQVLVKMSGQTDIVTLPAVKGWLSNPQQFLRSYQYESKQNQLLFVAEFDNRVLMQRLHSEGLPVWGNRRPESLLWLAIENERGQRYIVDEAQLSSTTRKLRQRAAERGVPLSLPLMDLVDNDAISVYDVWGRFAKSLTQASERYDVDYVIGARIYPVVEDKRDAEKTVAKGNYATDWIFIGRTQSEFGTLYGDSIDELAISIINAFAEHLGQNFAVTSGAENGKINIVKISVANINSLQKYVRSQRYLESISVIRKAALSQQHGSVATFDIELVGTVSDLIKSLSLQSRLLPVNDAFGQPLEGLNFYWDE
ncbi:DUF2066 domain-containing protein [Alteromonas sp. ASW11-130]|uniref:DUF2066 domain-containing protein n=1 Tax=Alteromonas sp. ASW11-130 TaxID=3015775 RepID=UPI002241B30D|nr:DUF2066 domain-containing protein [Alteromonas sp. ASW11-130]MCW8092427.1 DUF2066 domain-containing protein [Alteromonas sp. ASW11-130]